MNVLSAANERYGRICRRAFEKWQQQGRPMDGHARRWIEAMHEIDAEEAHGIHAKSRTPKQRQPAPQAPPPKAADADLSAKAAASLMLETASQRGGNPRKRPPVGHGGRPR